METMSRTAHVPSGTRLCLVYMLVCGGGAIIAACAVAEEPTESTVAYEAMVMELDLKAMSISESRSRVWEKGGKWRSEMMDAQTAAPPEVEVYDGAHYYMNMPPAPAWYLVDSAFASQPPPIPRLGAPMPDPEATPGKQTMRTEQIGGLTCEVSELKLEPPRSRDGQDRGPASAKVWRARLRNGRQLVVQHIIRSADTVSVYRLSRIQEDLPLRDEFFRPPVGAEVRNLADLPKPPPTGK
jgi:hypothetical protein